MAGGFFGKNFDFDGDGELNTMEQAMDFRAFNEMIKEEDDDQIEK